MPLTLAIALISYESERLHNIRSTQPAPPAAPRIQPTVSAGTKYVATKRKHAQ